MYDLLKTLTFKTFYGLYKNHSFHTSVHYYTLTKGFPARVGSNTQTSNQIQLFSQVKITFITRWLSVQKCPMPTTHQSYWKAISVAYVFRTALFTLMKTQIITVAGSHGTVNFPYNSKCFPTYLQLRAIKQPITL